jgi:hypothetical protein
VKARPLQRCLDYVDLVADFFKQLHHVVLELLLGAVLSDLNFIATLNPHHFGRL